MKHFNKSVAMYIHIYVHIYIYTFVCVCVCVCVCLEGINLPVPSFLCSPTPQQPEHTYVTPHGTTAVLFFSPLFASPPAGGFCSVLREKTERKHPYTPAHPHTRTPTHPQLEREREREKERGTKAARREKRSVGEVGGECKARQREKKRERERERERHRETEEVKKGNKREHKQSLTNHTPTHILVTVITITSLHIMSTNNKDIFTLFDKKAQGSIDRSMVGDYLRAIGYNPTNKQVQDLIDSQINSGSNNGSFTLEQLEQLIADNQQLLDSTTQSKAEDFIKAFQVFDKDNTGKVTVGDLKYMLTGLGEKLSDDEVEELLKGIEVDSDGGIDYRKFIEDILRQ